MAESVEKKPHRYRRWLFALVAGILCIVMALFLALQTSPARRFIEEQILSRSGTVLPVTLQVQGLSGILPFDIRATAITASDTEGVWLEIADARLRLSPTALLRGGVRVLELSARSVHTVRAPVLPQTDHANPPSSGLPDRPPLPKWLTVESISVERLSIAEALLPEAAVFSLEAAYQPAAETPLRAAIAGLDGTRVDATLEGGWHSDRIALSLTAEDASIAPPLLGVSGPLTLQARLNGTLLEAILKADAALNGVPLLNIAGALGLADTLRAKLTGTLSPPEAMMPEEVRARLGGPLGFTLDASTGTEGKVNIAQAGLESQDFTLNARGTLDADALRADLTLDGSYNDFAQLLGSDPADSALPLTLSATADGTVEALTLALDAELDGKTWIDAETLLVLTDVFSARGTLTAHAAAGLLPPEADALIGPGADLAFDLTLSDGALEVASAEVRADSVSLSANGTLDWARSLADLRFQAEATDLAAFSGAAGRTLAGSLQADATVQSDGAATAIHLEVQGDALAADGSRARELRVDADISGAKLDADFAKALDISLLAAMPGLELQPGFARDLTADAALTLTDYTQLEVARMNVGDGTFTAEASGRINLAARQADFGATLRVDDIAAYAEPFDFPYRGALQMRADVVSGEVPGELLASLQGRAENLRGFPDGLTDGVTEFRLRGVYDGEAARLEEATADTGALSLSGNGQYGIRDRSVTGTFRTEAADIAPFSALAGQPLRGGAVVTGELSGTTEALGIRGAIEPEALHAGPLRAEAGRIEFALDGLPGTPSGTITGALESGGRVLQAEAAFARDEIIWRLSSLRLEADGNSLRAQGTWNTETKGGAGTLNAALDNLDALRPWLAIDVGGAMTLDASLTERGAVTAAFSATALTLPGLAIGTATGSADLQDVFGTPSGRFELDAAEANAADLSLARVALRGEGPSSAFLFEAQAEGMYQQVLPFTMASTGVAEDAPRSLRLETLTGSIDRHAIALDAPAAWTAAVNGYTLTPARFSIGGGSLEVSGSLDEKNIEARAEWNAIPLALAELAGVVPYEGSISGSAIVSGAPAAPQASLDAAIAGLRPPSADIHDEAPALEARVAARFEDGAASMSATATIPNALTLQAEARAPGSWGLIPWRLDFPPDTQLSAQATGNGDLAAIPDLLGIEGQVLRGTLDASASASGTLGTPVLAGNIAIDNGYYENAFSGTILSSMTARLEAKDNAFQLARFSASDDAGGTLNASGGFSMDAEAGFPFSIKAELDNLRVVHRDDASARVGGTLAVSGDSAGAKAEGALTLGPAVFNLPERMPAQRITTVDFRVAGEDNPGDDAPPEETPPAYPVALDLRCDLPGRVFVRGPGLDSEWGGGLSIGGQAQAPTLRGTLQVRNGKLDFLGRVFDLRESAVAFSGQSPPTPMLNILAVAQQQDITARVRLEGEFDSLAVSLESDPPLPQDEVLSQILFGRSLTEVTPFQALQLARYAPLFSSRVSGLGLLGSGGSETGVLDRISLQTGAGIADTTITAGKNLGDDLYLEVEQGAGAKGSAISLEWLFAPNWSLRGKTGANAEGSAGVFWKKDY
jgi:translocation and assembly module TamB